MGEEVRMTDYQDDDRVADWELGLPAAHDLTPLSQLLIPPELASAFSISPGPHRSLVDVNRASKNTLSTLRTGVNAFSSSNLNPFQDEGNNPAGDDEEEIDPDGSGSNSRKLRKVDCAEEADSVPRTDSAAAVKRPRLVWTPQLHKRFVDVVAHLGIKNAVPKTIMQLMNVEGLTRENVASHLQKYRLYLKRMQGLSADGPSSSDHLFASTPVPQSLNDSGGGGAGGGGSGHSRGNGHLPVPVPVPMHYPPAAMMPMPMLGMPHGFHHHHVLQQRDWSYPPHVTPNDK
ncbi:transcription factor LUX-like [Arachis stenosperma]|uniref:transcription factor LUX-like n=1 Tax=Arachis stenosperma TaxID=217475 RepID=UPI0025ACA5F5|nr:transcription factor LUX-like [Arachis stenosperma]